MDPSEKVHTSLAGESAAILQAAAELHVPLARYVAQRARADSRPLCVGLCGAQGSGKSTTARILTRLLAGEGLSALALSIDDFYLPREQRALLGQSVHPLLVTRGVPGTHDVPLALATLGSLREGRATALPAFDKATDQRTPVSTWHSVRGPFDVLILEGWCVGALPQTAAELQTPVNELERDCDPDGTWRRYVNDNLTHRYQQWFALLDTLILLAAPSFDVVYGWRREQEQQLSLQTAGANESRVMNDAQLRRFVAHYERLTRHILEEMPQRADVVVPLDMQRRATQPWRMKTMITRDQRE